MLTLSWWETFIIGAAVSFLSLIAQKIKNPVELAALNAALTFLQKLLAGQVAHEAPVVAPAEKAG